MRNEIYYLPLGIYDLNIKAIKVAQCQWLQQAVIARDDRNGFYSPGTYVVSTDIILYNWPHVCTLIGTVVEVTEHEQFRIERTDRSRYVQVYNYSSVCKYSDK